MISGALYSIDANRVRTVNKAANVRSLSLIRDHRSITLYLVRGNNDTYLQQSNQRAQYLRMMYK